MIILDYKKNRHAQIIHACVLALQNGKVVAYPTDTSYGLAADASNVGAIKKLYKIKGRNFKKPVHIVVPSLAYAKKIVHWDGVSGRLAKKFWPGALTLVLGIKHKVLSKKNLKALSSGSGFLGIRMPKNQIALDLAKYLKNPITATSSNVSGQPDCYSAEEIIKQFQKAKNQPDIIINAGKLPKRKPSTVVKIAAGKVEVLRKGPVIIPKGLQA